MGLSEDPRIEAGGCPVRVSSSTVTAAGAAGSKPPVLTIRHGAGHAFKDRVLTLSSALVAGAP